jgi:type 1 glutamine amidotransferase
MGRGGYAMSASSITLAEILPADGPRALLVYGGWQGHHPERRADVYRGILANHGFAVDVSQTLDVFADAHGLDEFSLIVPFWTMGTIDEAQLGGLLRAVEGGVGLAGFHGGIGDSFRNEPEYQFMVGGQFVAHPDDIVEYRVEIVDPEHPITRGIGGFTVVSEQYYMHVDPGNHVLATTTFETQSAPWINGTTMPVMWTRSHRSGRVFYSSLGHSVEDHALDEVRALHTRGMLWASGRDLDGGRG